jgi:hypothetical protein
VLTANAVSPMFYKPVGIYTYMPKPNTNPHGPLLIFLIKVCLFFFIIVYNHGSSLINLILMNIPLIEIIIPLIAGIFLNYSYLSQMFPLLTMYKKGIPWRIMIREFIKQRLINSLRNYLINYINKYLAVSFSSLINLVREYFSRLISPWINSGVVYWNNTIYPHITKYYETIFKNTKNFSLKLAESTYNSWPVRVILYSIGIYYIKDSNLGDITLILGLIYCCISFILEVSTLIKYYSDRKDSEAVDLLISIQLCLLSGLFLLVIFKLPFLLKKWLVLVKRSWDDLHAFSPKAVLGGSNGGPSGGGPSGGPPGGGPSGGGPSGGEPGPSKKRRHESDYDSDDYAKLKAEIENRIGGPLSEDDTIVFANTGEPNGDPGGQLLQINTPEYLYPSDSYSNEEIPKRSFGPSWGIDATPKDHVMHFPPFNRVKDVLVSGDDLNKFKEKQKEYYASDEWKTLLEEKKPERIGNEALQDFFLLNDLSRKGEIDQDFANIMKKKLMLDRLVRDYAEKYPYIPNTYETRTEWLARVQAAHWLHYKDRIMNIDGRPKLGYNDIVKSMHLNILSTMRVSMPLDCDSPAKRATEYANQMSKAKALHKKYTNSKRNLYIKFD